MIQFRNRLPILMTVMIILMLFAVSNAIVHAEEARYSFAVVKRYPHDPQAFTQGLVFHDGSLYEGTGLYDRSSLRKVRLEDGVVLDQVLLEQEYFGEGITILGDHIVQLTWRENKGFVYDLETLEKTETFDYAGEGWGLTTDGTYLIMSDGSHVLTYLDSETFQPVRHLEVRGEAGPVRNLNELEYIPGDKGEIFANVWFDDRICRIDPETGTVLGWIDLRDLCEEERALRGGEDVLNGIAYDAANDRLFVTGKLWRNVYEIELELEE